MTGGDPGSLSFNSKQKKKTKKEKKKNTKSKVIIDVKCGQSRVGLATGQEGQIKTGGHVQ